MQLFGFSSGGFLIIRVTGSFSRDMGLRNQALTVTHPEAFLEGMFISNTDRRLGKLG